MAVTSETATPVRLAVATDWDAPWIIDIGVQRASERRPLEDVPPWGEYETTCVPRRPIVLHAVDTVGFYLSWVIVGGGVLGGHRIKPKIVRGGDDDRGFVFDPPIEVPAGENILLHLHNDADWARKPKIATIAIIEAHPGVDPHPPRRASEFTAVAPPQEPTLTAADSESSPVPRADSSDQRDTLTKRVAANKEWLSKNQFHDERVRSDCRANIDADERELARLDRALGVLDAQAAPTSVFTDVTLRGGAIRATGDAGRPIHAPAEVVHRPLLARMLIDGSGNVMEVRGCSCGADLDSASDFAAHIEWPVEAPRALIQLAGIIHDLLDQHALKREDVLAAMAHAMEVRR